VQRNSATTYLVYCLLFSVILSLVVYFFSILFSLEFSISAALVIFFFSFVVSFLFFYFVYQKIIYSRIDETLQKLRQFSTRRDEDFDFTYDTADPIDKLNHEIIQLANDRQKEVERLTRLENYRKEFLGNVSHELKTPIFNIQGYVSTLIDGGIYDENVNIEYLKRADRSVDRMINIIDDLETISQLESGSLVIDQEKFDVYELCKDVVEQLEMIAGKRSITLKVEPPEKTFKVMADKFRIRQVFVNLITNSIKYGKEGGFTQISFRLKSDKVFVEVTDNGIGIQEEHLPRLFERFYRVDKGRSREQGGTGLGLSIVKHILEAHDQNITVSSVVGQGTTFIFSLKKI
jgi:two-component system phosphate regulon sensor histidine kinase PhoR